MHQNSIDPAAKWIVQKYGGTSVGKFAAKIAEDIVPYVKIWPFFMTSDREILPFQELFRSAQGRISLFSSFWIN